MEAGELIKKLKLITIETTKQRKHPVMGWTCAYTPEEILMALGFIPYRVTGKTIPIARANALMPGNMCSHILSTLESGLHEEYNFLSGIIIANTSDAARRLYDVWIRYLKTSFVYMLDVPKVINERSEQYFQYIIQSLIDSIKKHFGLKFSTDLLEKSIASCNETRYLLRRLLELGTNKETDITNDDIVEITNLSVRIPKEEFNENLSKFISDLEPVSKNSTDSNLSIKILLTGSFYINSNIEKIVSEGGGQIVYADTCSKGRYFDHKSILKDNPLLTIAKYYLNKPLCARMIDSEKRFERILNNIKKFNVKGVIYYVLKFDDAYLFEFPYFKQYFNENGIPVLFIEAEQHQGNLGQLKTRIHAFIEQINNIGDHL